MTTITVAARTHSLVLTKAFAVKAAIFGTDEYKMLQEARRDYPGYKVTVGKTKEAKNIYAGLDYAYMEKYIAAHDDEEKTIRPSTRCCVASPRKLRPFTRVLPPSLKSVPGS